MLGSTRLGAKCGFAFAFLFAAMLASGCSAVAGEWIDTTKLPRLSGAKEIFASPATTQFTVPISVPLAAEATSRALAADGWQQYGRPFSGKTQNPNMAILEFKKGQDGLSVFINVAPAQGNATAVGYTAMALTNNLPFPKAATDIEFDYDRPLLNAVVTDSVDEMLDFYRRELGALGWSVWSLKGGANPPADEIAGVKHDKGAYAYYVREPQRPFATRPLHLVLQRGDDGRTKLELQGVAPELLMAQSKQGHDTPEFVEAEAKRVAAEKEKAAVEAKAKAEADARSAEQKAAADKMAEEIDRRTREAVAQAMAEIKAPAAMPVSKVPQTSKVSDETLRVLTDNPASIPLPETAEDVDFDAREGKLEFSSSSSVKTLAAFHRATLKPLGWKEEPSVINRPNMVVLDLSKGGKKISFTIMQLGKSVNVTANGSGLVTAAAKSDEDNAIASASAPVAEQELEAEEMSGLPVPTRHTMSEGGKSPFRRDLGASVPVDLAAVLGFYRRELGKRDWKETLGAVVKPDQAVLAFSTPDGPAVLKLGRKDGETSVKLAVRNAAEAEKAGVMPKSGQARFLFGNVGNAEVAVTINKQTIKVAAGVGAKKPDGPSLDLPPGKYKYSFKSAGGPTQTEEVEVGANETWGMMITPGGTMAMQVY